MQQAVRALLELGLLPDRDCTRLAARTMLDRLELEYGAQGQRLATDISFFVAQLV